MRERKSNKYEESRWRISNHYLPKAHKIMKYTRPPLNRIPLQRSILEKASLITILIPFTKIESKNMLERAAVPPPPPPPPPRPAPWTVVPFPLNEMEAGLHSITSTRNAKHSNSSKRRFDDTQIRSLETIFETESRPELRVKQQLANKLGLQPRQVAIWFQNKRARSKSKLIEREYSMLKGSYDNLASKYESLKKENESLLVQVKSLVSLDLRNILLFHRAEAAKK